MFGNGVTKNHLVGAAVGVGVAAVAFYLYKKNQAKVDDFLRKQGINIKTSTCSNLENLDIQGLTEMKEHIEDLIAEKSATESAEEIIVEAE
ncbi:hypothetical protein HMPREF9093_00715 [Fusobacterium sp. oral taxon 370 str. F0437]|uniref:hypothetical protein n=1 Tax=Fusobacterium sp. oral taxon 370 TaxID=712288 RepID=UPI000234A1C5|nr:hypothetical protein [Fusobacterium sp. oral taxon 370]EHI79010.1 hypothetical protein HMPREF9093_00715 [Fusobacterium sp. oral taxon 370 str. F0437]